jgi:BirA family biotin operon repressor/biotin-[acetyl-CoA-carboxylase] ligase
LPLPVTGNPIGMPFIELQSVDSTNKYAMQLLQHSQLPDRQDKSKAEFGHGTVFFAHEQTAGKGQRGKKWVAEKGNNITMSILLNPYPLLVTQQFRLSVCVAVSVLEFFSKYAGKETKIKWPNDLYWRDRKAGGVLIESLVRSRKSEAGSQKSREWKWVVAGIGINVNQTSFSSELPNPVSLKQITGKNFEPVESAKELCSFLDKNFQILVAGSFDALYDKYLLNLYKINETVKLKKGNRIFKAKIKGVSETGQLIIQHTIEERFDFGEIEWLIN